VRARAADAIWRLRDDQMATGFSHAKTIRRFIEKTFPDNQRYRIATLQMILDLVALEQHIQRHDGRSCLQNAVVAHREMRRVGEHDRNLVARTNTEFRQTIGDLVGSAVQFGIVQADAIEDDGGLSRRAASALLQQDGEIQHRVPPLVNNYVRFFRARAGDRRIIRGINRCCQSAACQDRRLLLQYL